MAKIDELLKKFVDGKKLTPLRAIRAKCLDCSGSVAEVRACPCGSCPLFRYRLGHRPVEN